MFELLAMVCVALGWLVPNHYPPWSSVYNETCSAAGLAFLALAVRRPLAQSRAPAAAWVLVAVATVPVLQWGGGLLRFAGDAWIASLYTLGLALAVMTGYAWASLDSRRAGTVLAATVVTGAVISCLIASAQFFGVKEFGNLAMESAPGMRAYANLGQPNNLATLIGMGAIGVLLLREQGRLPPWVGLVLAVAMVFGAAMTQSRTALLFGPAAVLGVMLYRRKKLILKTRLSTVALIAVFHWLTQWLLPSAQRALHLTPQDGLATRSIESVRFEMWPILFDALAQSPWTGYGWLQVGKAELAVVDKYPPVGELWLQGHNVFLELLLWTGYPLGLLLGSLLVYWFVSRARKVATLEGAIAMLLIAVFSVHCLLELPHHYAYFLVPVGLWAGQAERDAGGTGLLPAKVTAVPFAIGLALLLAILWKYPEVEQDFRLVRFENLRIGTLRADQPAPNAPFLSSLTAFLRSSRTTPAKGMSETDLDSLRAVVDRYPYAAGMFRLSVALALNGRLDEARSIFLKIRHVHGLVLYAKLKKDLHRMVSDCPDLLALDNALPD